MKRLDLSETSISNIGDQNAPAKRSAQYIASLAATIGSLAGGLVIGWSSAAGDNGKNLESLYGIRISVAEFTWIISLLPVGCGAICIPIGLLADKIGRKYSLLLTTAPFTVGWLLVILANSVLMFCIGRFILGLAAGAFCVLIPMYTAEIGEKEIRGALGSYGQLLGTAGVLLSFIAGTFVNIRDLSILSAVVPLVFFAVFVFMPESPVYYLMKSDEDSAKKSIIKLRGARYDAESELATHRYVLEENVRNAVSFRSAMRSRATLKGFVIAYGLMFFQQLSGINVVIFYSNSIFEKAGGSLNSSYSSIVIGVMQVLAVFASTLIVDRAGRRILLLASAFLMCLACLAIGIYFHLSKIGADVRDINWLPLASLSIFIIMFNMGFGPIPWMMIGEIFSPEVKGIMVSSACLFNWILVFVVTKFFTDLVNMLGLDATFWLFAVCCFISVIFVYLIVPETKGKSLAEIQTELSGK